MIIGHEIFAVDMDTRTLTKVSDFLRPGVGWDFASTHYYVTAE